MIDLLALKPNFSFWWMTLIAQKNNWAKSPQINHMLKDGLEDWINKNDCKELFINTKLLNYSDLGTMQNKRY